MFHPGIDVSLKPGTRQGNRVGKYCFMLGTQMRKNDEIVKLTHTLPASLGKEECIYLYIPFRRLYLKAILRLQIAVFKQQHQSNSDKRDFSACCICMVLWSLDELPNHVFFKDPCHDQWNGSSDEHTTTP